MSRKPISWISEDQVNNQIDPPRWHLWASLISATLTVLWDQMPMFCKVLNTWEHFEPSIFKHVHILSASDRVLWERNKTHYIHKHGRIDKDVSFSVATFEFLRWILPSHGPFPAAGPGYNEPMRTRVHNNAGSEAVIRESFQINIDVTRQVSSYVQVCPGMSRYVLVVSVASDWQLQVHRGFPIARFIPRKSHDTSNSDHSPGITAWSNTSIMVLLSYPLHCHCMVSSTCFGTRGSC